MTDGQLLEFSRVTKRFGALTAVDDLSARITPGAVTGFLGPNGAGKTTSLRILLGLVRSTSGTATIGGKAYSELRHPLRTVGSVMEEALYRPRRTAARQLSIAAKANGIPLSRVDEVMSIVGLQNETESRIGAYSLGMRQRLSVATALLGDPGALVLDEPANGLDPEGIRWMRLLMRRLADEGRTVLVSSHVLSEIEQIADDVLVLSKGRLVYADSISKLSDPTNGSVVVDAEDRGVLASALAGAGLTYDVLRSGLTVHDTDAATVGAVAASAGIALTTLLQRGPTLEEVFLDLVHGRRDPIAGAAPLDVTTAMPVVATDAGAAAAGAAGAGAAGADAAGAGAASAEGAGGAGAALAAGAAIGAAGIAGAAGAAGLFDGAESGELSPRRAARAQAESAQAESAQAESAQGEASQGEAAGDAAEGSSTAEADERPDEAADTEDEGSEGSEDSEDSEAQDSEAQDSEGEGSEAEGTQGSDDAQGDESSAESDEAQPEETQSEDAQSDDVQSDDAPSDDAQADASDEVAHVDEGDGGDETRVWDAGDALPPTEAITAITSSDEDHSEESHSDDRSEEGRSEADAPGVALTTPIDSDEDFGVDESSFGAPDTNTAEEDASDGTPTSLFAAPAASDGEHREGGDVPLPFATEAVSIAPTAAPASFDELVWGAQTAPAEAETDAPADAKTDDTESQGEEPTQAEESPHEHGSDDEHGSEAGQDHGDAESGSQDDEQSSEAQAESAPQVGEDAAEHAPEVVLGDDAPVDAVNEQGTEPPTETTEIAGIEIFASLAEGQTQEIQVILEQPHEDDHGDDDVTQGEDPRAAAVSASLAAAARAYYNDDAPSYVPSDASSDAPAQGEDQRQDDGHDAGDGHGHDGDHHDGQHQDSEHEHGEHQHGEHREGEHGEGRQD
ncbi:ABC-type multidrug transport system ATPase subunit [Microbacterium resistens]|uniref:ABC-type multidrug transport system ATPase subunit n=1 Tax=Microbacterium resistens TaxID=156977 RepID=A0ABU1SB81_9MICO|nr:ATP-binding cassette domain-containing protein [Microbacterium resistens]MDR6866877.1 ABC-type multidrug transport system ATPase subunit [Microbacterium resistens]